MKEYKNPFCIRHAHLSCPLPLALESYWNCEANCHHCPGRKLNDIWGKEQRITNPARVKKKLVNALNNKKPHSSLAVALSKKKTLWLGRKTDPYQTIETEKHITRAIISILNELDWSHVVCSRYTDNMLADEKLFMQKQTTLLIEITPGGEKDWELFERKRTTPVEDRLLAVSRWIKLGIPVGVRGEPFIPGYHTFKQFRTMLRRLKKYKIKSYNTYNMHINSHNIKRLHKIGLDIEKIWSYNQDNRWSSIQKKLCIIADDENMVLGCPDFVNVPAGWKSTTNTCCGVDVPNPFRFNTHHWKRLLQKGYTRKKILKKTYEGISKDEELANKIIYGNECDYYTMKDAGL